MRRAFIFVSITFFLLTFCGSRTGSDPDGTGSFSYKNGYIAFTYFKNNIGSVYYTSSVDFAGRQLTFPKAGWDLTADLSSDLSKILYVNYPKSNYEVCNICLYDLKTGNTDTLLKNGRLITDVCLSNDNKYVYFLNASEIRNYSPIASKAPHGTDIFELNVETRDVRKLTNLGAYSMASLRATFLDSVIVASCYDKNGIIALSTLTGNFTELNFDSPRKEVKELFSAVDLRPDSILYIAPYELYKHNLKTDRSEFLLRCPDGYQFGIVEVDSTWTNILFNCGGKQYCYNVPNKKLTEIYLRIK